MEFCKQWWKSVKVGSAVPQPSCTRCCQVWCCDIETRGGNAYLDNLIAANELVDVFPWAAVKEDAGQVDRALPGLEPSFVDAGADVRVLKIVESLVVGGFIFGHELNTDVGEIAAREVYCLASG